MSNRAITWARTVRGVSSTQKLVLLLLADTANDAGEAWPSVPRLVADSGLKERAVQMAIRDLTTGGLLTATVGGGRHRTSLYRLLMADTETPQGMRGNGSVTPHQMQGKASETPHEVQGIEDETPHLTTETPHLTTETPHQMHPNPQEPSRTLKVGINTLIEVSLGEFEDWWSFYPRKVGKDGARKAYAAAIKRGATHAELAYGLQRQKWPTETRYIPHPATWLNGGRWQDDPEAAAPRPTQPEKPRSKLAWMWDPSSTVEDMP